MSPLTIAERKHRMPFGAQRQVATEEGASESYISAVMNDEVFPKTEPSREKLTRIQAALAAKLGLPVEEVFPPKHDAATAAA